MSVEFNLDQGNGNAGAVEGTSGAAQTAAAEVTAAVDGTGAHGETAGDGGGGAAVTVRRVALVAAAALLLGALARALTFGSAQPAPDPPVAAWLSAQGPVLTPAAVIRLRLVLTTTEPDVWADRIDLRGGGMAVTTLALERTLEPGRDNPFPLEVELRCPTNADPALTATVQVRSGSRAGTRSVPVVLQGQLSSGGGCGAARQQLPDGWQRPIVVEEATLERGGLLIRVAGLDPGDRVAGVSAAGASLRVGNGPDADPGRLLLLAPLVDCRGWAGNDVVPTGVRLLVASSTGGLTLRYAAIGAPIARWFRQLRQTSCAPPP